MSTTATRSLPLSAPPAASGGSDWDHSTLRLNKADVTLFQALGDSAQRRPCLILYSGEHSGQRHVLQGNRLLLGRSPECDVCLESPGISRRHAELREDGDHVLLQDAGSSNGTWLNDRRLEAPTVLHDGDLVRLGNVVFKYYERHSLDALLHDRIYRLATVDTGTEVYTKKYLQDTLEREFKLARRSGRSLAVLCLDLDHFKAVNDRFGHAVGDQVLRAAAQAAQGALRGSDVLGRIGGEEFAVVLPDTDEVIARALADRVRQAVAELPLQLVPAGGGPEMAHRQTVSVGLAMLSPAMLTARDLLGAADAMLYAAKRDGRDCVRA